MHPAAGSQTASHRQALHRIPDPAPNAKKNKNQGALNVLFNHPVTLQVLGMSLPSTDDNLESKFVQICSFRHPKQDIYQPLNFSAMNCSNSAVTLAGLCRLRSVSLT